MDNEKEKKVEETAMACKTFLEKTGALMVELDLPPRLVVHLFGMFTKRVVTNAAASGEADVDEATMMALDDFMQGMGMKTGMMKVEGEEAKQMIAEFERANSEHPVQ